MRRAITAAGIACVVLGASAQAWAQEGISVFEGGGGEDGPIQIGGGQAGEDEDVGEGVAPAGGLVIEGVHGSGVSSSQSWGGGGTLSFVENAGVMFVPATVSGKKVWFIFDTGAGLTTLTPSFAKKIGVLPGKNSPRMTMMTASGPQAARLGVARSIRLANVPLGPFTFSTCGPCGQGSIKGAPVVGLLGRNVLSQLDFRIDDAGGKIKLRQKPGARNQRRDIEPWISYGMEGSEEPGQATFVMENRAARTIRNVKYDLVCETNGAGSFTQKLEFSRIGARKQSKKRVKVIKGGSKSEAARWCMRPTVKLRSATW